MDLRYHPRLHDSTKVLLLLDIGGSMDDHVHGDWKPVQRGAQRIQTPEHFYFQPCVYESLWKHNTRRWNERTPPPGHALHTYGRDHPADSGRRRA